MLRFHLVGVAALVFSLFANLASAQTLSDTSRRDSLWNGTLIGLGAGVGSAAALDGVFCENGFGGCDFPWAAYLTLGGIGAGAGAGIDFLIGRKANERKTTLRLLPIVGPSRKGVLVSLVLPQRGSLHAKYPGLVRTLALGRFTRTSTRRHRPSRREFFEAYRTVY